MSLMRYIVSKNSTTKRIENLKSMDSTFSCLHVDPKHSWKCWYCDQIRIFGRHNPRTSWAYLL